MKEQIIARAEEILERKLTDLEESLVSFAVTATLIEVGN